MAKDFVTIEVIVQTHDEKEPPYPFSRTEAVGEAKQKFSLPASAANDGAISLDKLVPALLVMASADYDKDQQELAEKVAK